MEVIQVTDYDVLADVMPGEKFVLSDYKKHIGNSRFGVLLDMYREAFEISYSQQKDEDCQKIVERIVDVTCHKDVSIIVTKGRFLVKPNGEGDWETLVEEKARKLVHQILSNPPDDDEEEEEETEVDTVPSSLSSMSINDKKRGRRRSLLRRSASESTMLEDKKKTYRVLGVDEDDDDDAVKSRTNNMSTVPIPNLRRGHSAVVSSAIPTTMSSIGPGTLARQLSVPIPSSNGMIASHKGMDVVLAEDGKNLSSTEGIVGNNRLQVMLTLQGARYGTLPPGEQDKVAKDLVRAVCQYWGGRILVEQGLSYRKLDDAESHESIKNLLAAESEGELSVVGSGSVAPTHTVSSGSSSPKPLLAAPQPPDFLRNASMELLSVGGMGRPPNMQSQAVKSLQQRKAKRAIAKNLGQGRSIPDHFPDFNEMGPSS
mmetsp:Transcript_106511/g.159334  ORF Transcript_106511/g.159334 Transcript_106511/m.159334 type:complete len:428 (+) Transcript_106511:126-1409(+)